MNPSPLVLAGAAGIGLLILLELLFGLLSRFGQRPRRPWIYHTFAITVATATTLTIARQIDSLGWRLASSLATLLAAIVGISLVDTLLIQRPWAPDKGPVLPKLARDVLRAGVVVAAALLVATRILDYPLPAVLVSSTVLSAVVGLALQDVLKNVFAGMALELEKPFSRGDWLLLEGQAVEVLDTSWRSVRLRSNEGIEFFEPNSMLSTQRLVNYGSGTAPIGISFHVGLSYDAPPAQVRAALLRAARSLGEPPRGHPPRAFVDHFSESSIDYKLRVWTRDVASLSRFRDLVYSRIWYELRRSDLAVPYPVRTVELKRVRDDQEQHRTRDREEYRLLSSLPLFAGLDRDVIERLAASVRRAPYDDGEILMREGEAGDSLFVVASGRVLISKSGRDLGTGEIQLASLGPGQFLGEMSLLTGDPRSATVRADGPCDVLVLTKRRLAPLLEERPELAEVLSEALLARRAETEATVESRRESSATGPTPEEEQSILGRIRDFFKLQG